VILSLKQTQALDYLEDQVTRELLFGGGAGGGKSMLGCYWQLKRRIKYPGTRGLIGRASLKTLKETTLLSFFDVCKRQGVTPGRDFVYNQQASQINFANGSLIFLKDLFLYPSDKDFDELGSLEITDAFIDECNQLVEKAWTITKSRIRWMLDEYGLVPKIMGSCNPAKNFVYTRFYKPSKDGILPPSLKFIQALAQDNPRISKHYVENLMSMDAASRARLLEGLWEYDADPAIMIEYDKIVESFQNVHLAAPDRIVRKISVDVARFGKDKTTIGNWYSPNHVKIETHSGLSTSQTADLINYKKDKYGTQANRIVIDEDGVGGGVVDQVPGSKGFVNNSTPHPDPEKPRYDPKTGRALPGHYKNLKSMCAYYLAKRINNRQLYIECDDPDTRNKITEELDKIRRADIDKDGPFAIISKEKVKGMINRSPDYSDNLLMAEEVEIRPKLGLFAATI